mmetsp:Transcript_83548/g.258356  ORF Transcript_83548/g.258356 Transcript_83548/m.258356 type:complete len:485 (+) Transcript_83548:60-1514(+)
MKRASCALRSRFSKWKLKEEPGLKEPQGSRKQKLAQDLLVCSGLELFCRDFCQSIEHLLRLFAKFWELMQVLDAEWFEKEGEVLQTHVWALRMGLGSASPSVFRQLQRHVKVVKEFVDKLRDQEEVLQARDKAWVEKEHYQRKLNELRSELSRRDRSGQAITAEQMERLQRNEAKHARAQDLYDSIHTQAQAYRAAKCDLKAALCDVVRTVACGWFISVGAGVCRAVSEAESAQRGEQRGRSAPTSSRQQALPGWPPEDDFTSHCTVEVEELEPFDPANPFKGSWRCESVDIGEEEDSSDGGGGCTRERFAMDCSSAWSVGETEEQDTPIESLSEQTLRQRLADQGLGVPSWCADRAALIELVRTLERQGGPSPSSTAGGRTPAHGHSRQPSRGGVQEASPPGGALCKSGAGTPARCRSPCAFSPVWRAEMEAGRGGGSVDALQGLSESELREMLAASGLPTAGTLTRAELSDILVRSQTLGFG